MHQLVLTALMLAMPVSGGSHATLSTPFATNSEFQPLEYERAYTAPRLRSRDHRRIQLELFTQGLEFGEVEYQPDVGSDTTVEDVERRRFGFRGAFGKRATRGYFQVFGERWDESGFATGDEFRMFGIGGGVLGEPIVGRFEGDNIQIVLPYRAGFNIAWGDEETATVDEETAYVEFEGEFGVGVDIYGVRPMVGFYANSLAGYADVEPSGNFDYDGSNLGGFLEVRVSNDEFPITSSFRILGGDVEGFMFTFGATF